MNKEKTSSSVYIPFHRERQKPIDKYTRAEVDAKLEALKNEVNEQLNKVIEDIERDITKEFKELNEAWKARYKDLSDRFTLYSEKKYIDRLYSGLQSYISNVEFKLDKSKDRFEQLHNIVIKYLSDAKLGEMKGNKFVFHNKKKGWLKKK